MNIISLCFLRCRWMSVTVWDCLEYMSSFIGFLSKPRMIRNRSYRHTKRKLQNWRPDMCGFQSHQVVFVSFFRVQTLGEPVFSLECVPNVLNCKHPIWFSAALVTISAPIPLDWREKTAPATKQTNGNVPRAGRQWRRCRWRHHNVICLPSKDDRFQKFRVQQKRFLPFGVSVDAALCSIRDIHL